jgi:hypothetical protein
MRQNNALVPSPAVPAILKEYMALYVRQNESRAQLSSKVAADLAQRLNKRAVGNDDAKSAMLLRNHRKTTGGGLFWAIIIVFVLVAALIYFIFIY